MASASSIVLVAVLLLHLDDLSLYKYICMFMFIRNSNDISRAKDTRASELNLIAVAASRMNVECDGAGNIKRIDMREEKKKRR